MGQFEEAASYSHDDVRAALRRDGAQELRQVVVAVALNDASYPFALELCVRLASHRDSTVRGNALLGFGHLARRFGEISDEGRALVKAGLADAEPHVRAQSESAFDDIELFAR